MAESWARLAGVLSASAPGAKTAAANGCLSPAPLTLQLTAWIAPPDRPARPPSPVLVAPQRTPRRRLGSEKGRTALLHALAHIEFNAIDLAFDMALRFAPAVAAQGLDWRKFVSDWTRVGREEARHFMALDGRLKALGSSYGSLPAHDGLWESAARTADDVLARLAIAPLVLEARGLDVTPRLIAGLAAIDGETAAILEGIYEDEIGHVAVGVEWFRALADARGLDSAAAFRNIIKDRFKGELKPPFNHLARDRAGLDRDYYDPLPEARPAEARG